MSSPSSEQKEPLHTFVLNKLVTYLLWILLLVCRFAKMLFTCGDANGEGRDSVYALLFRRNVAPTGIYCLVYLCFGLCVGFLGPTEEEWSVRTGASLQQMSWTFFIQAAFSLVGSIVIGFFARRYSTMFLLLICVSMLPLSLVALAFVEDFALLGITLAVMGIFMGAVDCLANLEMVNLYEKAVTPFMQAMYLAYGLGALLPPCISQSLIKASSAGPDDIDIGAANHTEAVNQTFTVSMVTTTDGDVIDEPVPSPVRASTLPGLPLALAAVQVPVIFLILWYMYRKGFQVRTTKVKFERLINSHSSNGFTKDFNSTGSTDDHIKMKAWEKHLQTIKDSLISKWRVVALLLCGTVVVFLADGIQGNFNDYGDSYLNKMFKKAQAKSKDSSNIYFWAFFTVGRLLAIFISFKFTPFFMLLVNIMGCLTSMFLMLVLRDDRTAFMATIAFLGLFLSTLTPTMIAAVEQVIVISTFQMSTMVVSAAAGETLMPLLIGQVLDQHPFAFMLSGIISVCLMAVLFIAFYFTAKDTDKYRAGGGSFIWNNNLTLISTDDQSDNKELNDLDLDHNRKPQASSQSQRKEREDSMNFDLQQQEMFGPQQEQQHQPYHPPPAQQIRQMNGGVSGEETKAGSTTSPGPPEPSETSPLKSQVEARHGAT